MASHRALLLKARAYALELKDDLGLALSAAAARLDRVGERMSDEANRAWAEVIQELEQEGSDGP